MYPLLARDITSEPYCANRDGLLDLVTPYGYGGPYCQAAGDPGRLSQSFWQAFSEWAGRENVVSEFVRFTLFQHTILDFPGEREMKLDNIVRDLELDEEQMWMEMDHKVRKNVKHARKSEVTVEVDLAGVRFDEFFQIYNNTMDRRDAGGMYYFPRSFFEAIMDGLAGQFAYFHAVHRGRVVSTELVLLSEENAYSFLGGTDSEAFDLRPNDLLRYEIINWLRDRGMRRYVLGGGYQQNDGIFRFKRGFAPNGLMPFYVGTRIIRQDLFEQLVENRAAYERANGNEWQPRDGYFPAYRG